MTDCIVTSRRYVAKALALGALLALAACNETASDFNPNAAPRAKAPGVPVALVSLEGAPEILTSRFSVALSQQAARREILIVGVDGKPRYQIRGYVTLQQSEGVVSMAWTFDLFDGQRKRAHRASGAEPVAVRREDWSEVKDSEIERVAFRALDEVAAFLAAAPAPVATAVPRLPAARSISLVAGE